MTALPSDRCVRLPELCRQLSIGRTLAYELMRTAPAFPRPVRIGVRAVAFLQSDIDAFIASRVAERDRTTDNRAKPPGLN